MFARLSMVAPAWWLAAILIGLEGPWLLAALLFTVGVSAAASTRRVTDACRASMDPETEIFTTMPYCAFFGR